MKFFKVGVEALNHVRFHSAEQAAPGSISLWVWCVGHAFEQRSDGAVPFKLAQKLNWGGDKNFQKRIDSLTNSGLISVDGDAIVVLQYAKQNLTKEQQDAYSEAARERKRKSRENKSKGLAQLSQRDTVLVSQPSHKQCHVTEENRIEENRIDLKPSSVPLEVRSPKGSPKIGKRIAEDYFPTETTLQQCRLLGHSSPQDLVPAFIDYWIAKTGQSASKLNWDATFRNWVRTDLKNGYGGKRQLQRNGFTPAVEQTILAAMGGNNEF